MNFIKQQPAPKKHDTFKVAYTTEKKFERNNLNFVDPNSDLGLMDLETKRRKGEDYDLNSEDYGEVHDDIRYVSDAYFSTQVSNSLCSKPILQGYKNIE